MSNEPLMAAMFSIEMTGRMYCSFPLFRKSIIVRGTKMISDTSFVTNIDVKKTQKTRKRERLLTERNLVLNLMSGLKMFSFLNPSRIVSIMNSVPSVRQSIFPGRSAVGGFRIMAETAAIIESRSMGSFFRKASIFFIATNHNGIDVAVQSGKTGLMSGLFIVKSVLILALQTV